LSGVRTLVKMVAEKERFPDAASGSRGSLDVGIQITVVMEPGRTSGRLPGTNQGDMLADPALSDSGSRGDRRLVDAGLAGKVLSADRRTWLVIYLNTWAETAEFAMHVEHERLESWGAVYVFSSAGNAVLSLKGEGTERWQNFEV
jgi:hypothetical protein